MKTDQIKCANCELDALYVYRITDTSAVSYCDGCLPKFLYARKSAGTLDTTAALAKLRQESVDLLKSTPTVVEETPVVVEAPSVEPETTTKKSTKKEPTVQPDAE
jgi:hypothetical protein